ncbi:MAG: DNA internalization-related competence protein ComEC/Rec2 [Hydrogenophilales bacterium 28-61-23]|nr:MAG: DNA internalization-related competence protein ComEC/Rec2 [Hydrogenophilales bacterium 28-61-23]
MIGLRALIVAFAIGAAWLQTRPALPALAWASVLPLCGLLLAGWLNSTRPIPGSARRLGLFPHAPLQVLAALILFGLVGFFYAAWRAETLLAETLPAQWNGRDVALTGRVIGLPETTPNGLRFVLDLERAHTPGAVLPKRVQLGWFVRPGASVTPGEPAPSLKGGDCIDLVARLHRPHGGVNPGGFDYEAWLLERGIRATGNLVGQPMASAGCSGGARAWLDRTRTAVRAHLRAALAAEPGAASYDKPNDKPDDKPYAGVVVALAVGDQDAIPSQQWTLFRQTGTSHLFSVSGLHITLFSALVFGLVRLIWRRIPALNLRVPARTAGMVLGLLGAAAYTALSGFGIPAQRTLLMLAAAVGVALLDRTPTPSRLLAAALAAVVLVDPWAANAPGFWLSFGAVAALLFSGLGRRHPTPIWLSWPRTQWAITLALTPLLLSLFQEVSLVSPLANAVAIPLVSMVAVPLSLLAAALPWQFVATAAHGVVAGVMWLLEWLVRLPQPLFHAAAPSLPALLLALAGAGLLLLPRGIPARWLGWLLFLPLFFPRLPAPPEGEAWLTVLDVGQGEAILLRTARHALLVDTGPRYASGEDAGARVVAPALWRQGINRLDGLVLTHDDLDHTGGAAAILQSHRPAWLLTPLAGVPTQSLGEVGQAVRALRPDALTCRAGQTWNWDGVGFEVLHPPAHHYVQTGHSDNNRGCVIRVRTARFSALLAADIERLGEMNLMERGVLQPVDVLVAPHHGSLTSSTPAFLAALRPRWVVIPVGHRNRYGHPHPEVLARYRALGVTLARTDRDGAVTLRLGGETVELERARATEKRYWRE